MLTIHVEPAVSVTLLLLGSRDPTISGVAPTARRVVHENAVSNEEEAGAMREEWC